MNLNNRKTIIKLLIVAVLILFAGLGYWLFSDSWLGGANCLYDQDGFSEIKNGQTITLESGNTAVCERGKLVFK